MQGGLTISVGEPNGNKIEITTVGEDEAGNFNVKNAKV